MHLSLQISIAPRTNAILGYTQQLPLDIKLFTTEEVSITINTQLLLVFIWSPPFLLVVGLEDVDCYKKRINKDENKIVERFRMKFAGWPEEGKGGIRGVLTVPTGTQSK